MCANYKKGKWGQKGSVIVEALVASAILATAIFGLAAFQINLYRWQEDMVEAKTATMLAEDQMGAFRNYTTLNATAGQLAYDDIQNGTISTTINQTTYAVTSVVTDVNAQNNNDINNNLPIRKIVNVTVNWRNYSGVDSSVNLNGVITRIDPVAAGEVSREMNFINLVDYT